MENAEFIKAICSKEQSTLIVTYANCESRRLNKIQKFVSYLEENVPQLHHEHKPVKSFKKIVLIYSESY